MERSDLLKHIRAHCKTRGEAIHLIDEIFPRSSSMLDEAKAFLKQHLRQPTELPLLLKLAARHSINYRTLRRAAIELGVESKTTGFGPNRVSIWRPHDE